MKGIILAGGTGSRLDPITRVTNKHLLPVYNQPMIMLPLKMFIRRGITDIMIVSGRGHAGHFLELLGSGDNFGANINYAVQEKSGGIAQALSLTENFAEKENIVVVLGDNIYEEDPDFSGFKSGARVYLKEVPDPERSGVATMKGDKVVKIVEKPKKPESNLAVTGLYLYDKTVYEKIKILKPSKRGELEITDVNNKYIEEGKMEARFVKGEWADAGTIESLYKAGELVRNKYMAGL